MRPEYVIGLDLGRAHDYTAVAIAERRAVRSRPGPPGPWLARNGDPGPPEKPIGSYDVVHLDRLPLGTPYTAVPGRLRDLIGGVEAVEAGRALAERARVGPAPAITLVVDQTGVGVAVVDVLRAAGLAPVAVTIHGGDATTEAARDEWRVPKRELVGVVQVLLQSRRLRIAEGLAHTPTLVAELQNFKAKISLAGHDSYGAGADWREGNHDDLVLAVALACWYGESRPHRTASVGSYLARAPDRGPRPSW